MTGWLTALAAVLTAANAVMVTLMPLVLRRLNQVRTMVNGNHAVTLARVDQLQAALTASGTPIPDAPVPAAGPDAAVGGPGGGTGG